jgi:hypothetical protein
VRQDAEGDRSAGTGEPGECEGRGVARDVGYESEAAFKRAAGFSPGAWRRRTLEPGSDEEG